MGRDPAATAEPVSFGPRFTKGASFRARAEARQRRYRAEVLRAGWDRHGHWLEAEAARNGANFVVPAAHSAAVRRCAAGKGVTERTFQNMLSSQAMCFNLFGPLADDADLATAILTPLLPGLVRVNSIVVEHTPAADVFGDQAGLAGVDCDVLIETTFEDGPAVFVIETKFVEEEFSVCAFRRAGRASRGLVVCPHDVRVREDRGACAYQGLKGYGYWNRADQFQTIARLPERGCPFGGPHWQLWVNHTLAHVEAARRGGMQAGFLVCAPRRNDKLLHGGQVLDDFRALLTVPSTAALLPLDEIIDRIAEVTGEESEWARGLRARYGGI